MSAKVYYAVLERDPEFRYVHTPRDFSGFDCRAVEEIAMHFHQAEGGWEANWPLTFVLYESEDGPEVCRYVVDRESMPYFRALACGEIHYRKREAAP